MLFNQPAFGRFKPETKIIQPLLPTIDAVHHAPKRPVPRGFSKRLPCHQQPISHCSRKPQT